LYVERGSSISYSSGSQTVLTHSSICSFWKILFPPYYTSLQEYLIFQYILSHLPLTCHGVAYVRVHRLVLTTIGTMVFIDDNNLINKSGTKSICCQIMALKFVCKNVWYSSK